MPRSTLLIIDDEPNILTTLRRALELEGYGVEVAGSGSIGLEKLAECDIDMVLLDVMMPEMDGVSTFKALAAAAETRNIPVIFMTAKVQSHEKADYVGFGAAGVIAKPFDPMRLPSDIQNILSQPVEQRGKNRIAALQRRYAEGLSSKIDGLRAAVEHAHSLPEGADPGNRKVAVEAAHRIAHTLHGTAGTYGHAEVSRAMGSVELALERLLADTVENEDECWRLIEVGLDRAARSIE